MGAGIVRSARVGGGQGGAAVASGAQRESRQRVSAHCGGARYWLYWYKSTNTAERLWRAVPNVRVVKELVLTAEVRSVYWLY